MNKVLYLAVTLAVITTSCAQRSRKPVTIASTSDTTALEMTVKTSVFDCPDSSLGPCRLCDQKLTSIEAVFSAFPNRTDEFLSEATSADKAFYYPASDIKDLEFVKNVQIRYNYVAVLNRVVHSLEWFQRMATAADFDPDTVTKKDTLKWIKQSQPRLSATMLDRALPNPTARMNANAILAAYSKFDGDTDDGSAFSVAFNNYRGFELPGTVSKDQLNHFEKGFWEWYDKRISVPEIDEIVKMSSRTKTVTKPTEEQLHNLRCVIEAETNIDKRTILALEYIKLSGGLDGVELLGEILESGIYTKYLLEAWISWRANVQLIHSPSSFSVIANNYYDMLRVKCIDTFVRHCVQEKDENAECLLENLIFCEIIHRMGSLTGNSSFATVADLSYSAFIHPRSLKKE